MGYLKNVLIAIDQLGNTIAGGNPDCTISGRTGYFAKNAKNYARWYWLIQEFIIDATFFPIDGMDHCYNSWQEEIDEEYHITRKGMLLLLGFFAIGSCMILIAPFYIVYFIKKIIQIVKTDN